MIDAEFQGAFVLYAVALPSGRTIHSLQPHTAVSPRAPRWSPNRHGHRATVMARGRGGAARTVTGTPTCVPSRPMCRTCDATAEGSLFQRAAAARRIQLIHESDRQWVAGLQRRGHGISKNFAETLVAGRPRTRSSVIDRFQ